MAKITSAELRKLAPNITAAELKRRLLIMGRLEKFEREVQQRSQTPEARRSAQREWQSHIASTLALCKRGFDDGHESAMLDAVLFCEQTNIPKPPWVRDALHKFLRDRIERVPSPKKIGRPSHPLRDIYIYDSVNWWRQQKIIFGQKGKTRPFSFDRAFAMVRNELAERGYHLSPGAIRAAYKRGKQILSEPHIYHASIFSDSVFH